MRRAWPLTLPFLLCGCGGSGGGDTSFFQGSVGSANVQFTAGTDYNGSTTALNVLTAIDGSAATNAVTITATNNNRAVEVALIARKAIAGTVVDLSGTTGSSVLLTDTTAGTTTAGRWSSNSGTVTIQGRTSSSITLLLTNVVLEAPSGGISAAKGTVTLNGSLTVTAS